MLFADTTGKPDVPQLLAVIKAIPLPIRKLVQLQTLRRRR